MKLTLDPKLIIQAVQAVEALKHMFKGASKSTDKLAAARQIVVTGLGLVDIPHESEIIEAIDAAINLQVAFMNQMEKTKALVAAYKK